MADEIQKSFVLKFNDFLKQQIQQQTLPSDGLESLEVAIQCLEAAFELNADDDAAQDDASKKVIKQRNPIDLFELYQSAFLETSSDRKELAESIKNDGNRLMKECKFQEALLQYNRAIAYDPTNPVFYSNRAAAFLRLSQFDKAIGDCKMALVYNPDYGKAYGRMGIAYSNLNKFEEARTAYKKALELEPDNQDYKNNLKVAEERITASCTAGENIGNNQALPNWQSFLSSVQGVESNESPANIENMFNSPAALGNMFGDMLRDPVITSALHSLADNPRRILDLSRQVAAAISTENPYVLRDVRETIMTVLNQNIPNENNAVNNTGNPQNEANKEKNVPESGE